MKLGDAINLYSEEGVDHIQLSPHSNSKVGKLLSPEWRQKFFIPQIGSFVSPIAFCNWISGGGEEARFDDRVKGKIKIPYKLLLVVSKYHQLLAMTKDLRTFPEDWTDVPLTRYRRHTNGVKELVPDNQWYPDAVYHLTACVIQNLEPEWDEFAPNFKPYELIDELIHRNIMGVSAEDYKNKKHQAKTKPVEEDAPASDLPVTENQQVS